MPRPTVKLDRKAVRELLQSKEVLDDLERRADNIREAAGDGFEWDSEIGPTRARAAVYTADLQGMRAEATERALTKAIDAGRQ